MRIWRWVFLALAPVQALSADSAGFSALVDRVAPDSIYATMSRLVAFETRFTGSDSNTAAARWLARRLEGLGCIVEFDSFSVHVDRILKDRRFVLQNVPQANVIGIKPGVLFRDRTVVLGAHYDTIALDRPPSEQEAAPGADDNASGVAALLEIARVVRDADLDVTVVFALWGAEELGLIGSRHYASRARERRDDVLLMVQMDAIGTRSAFFPDAFSIDTIGPYHQQGEDLAQAAETYSRVRASNSTGGRVWITPRGCGCSDHQSFLDEGFPALGVFQYLHNPSTHLNTSFDTLDQVDLSLVTEITRAVLAGLLHFAGFPGRSADFNGDGLVSFPDFLLFVQAFSSPEHDPRFDLNRDGQIGFADFIIFSEVFGRSYP